MIIDIYAWYMGYLTLRENYENMLQLMRFSAYFDTLSYEK